MASNNIGVPWPFDLSISRLDSLFPVSGRLSFLAGSGISADSPSAQPTGHQFTKAVISHLVPAEKRPLIEKLIQLPATPSGGQRFLRFEHLMQMLQRWDPDLHILDGYASCITPNINHCILARFVMAGHPTFTTNFDNLLEFGLLDAGVPQTSIAPVIFERDWVAGETPGQYRIFKLHGALIDFRTLDDSRSSVQATIRQIAKGKAGALQLESWKIALLKPILESTDLVVIGYSGLDDFDVLPTLSGLKSNRRLIWIDHQPGVSPDDAEIEVLSAATPRQPLRRIDNYLASLAGSCRDASQIIMVRVHTGQFLAWLAGRMLAMACSFAATHDAQPVSPGFPDVLRLSEAEKAYFTGGALSHFYTMESLDLLGQAVNLARSEGNPRLVAASLTYRGRQYETLSYRETAGTSAFKNHWDAALACFMSARETSRALPDIEDRKEESKAINNLGQLYRFLPDGLPTALEHYREALSIDERIGDLEGIARDVNNIATAEHEMGNLEEASKLFMRACNIDEQLGDLFPLAFHLHNLGWCRIGLGLPQGLTDVQNALTLAKSLGLRDAAANCLHTIGTYQQQRRQFEEALKSYTEALEFTGDQNVEMTEMLRRSVASLTRYLQGVKNVGLRCACDTALYFTNDEHELLLKGVPILTQCKICGKMLFVRGEERRIALYEITEVREGGHFIHDPRPLSTWEHS